MVAPSSVPPSNPLIVVLGITGGFPQSATRYKHVFNHKVNVVILPFNVFQKSLSNVRIIKTQSGVKHVTCRLVAIALIYILFKH